jgi:hypothetical protein
MKTFKQYLREQKESPAPQGVIFKGDKVAYVGEEHGTPIKLRDDLLKKVQAIGKQYGYWYEGIGGGVDNNMKNFGSKKDYQGSWDEDEFTKQIEGYPSEFLYVLFANTEVNHQKENITDPKLSIFDSILKNQKKVTFFKDRTYDAKTLKKFLNDASESDTDFFKMSQQSATKENVIKFIDKGEQLSWPKNWEEYPYNAGKQAYKANLARNKFLLSRKEGVYFAGSGHLKELLQIDKSLELIGGEKID